MANIIKNEDNIPAAVSEDSVPHLGDIYIKLRNDGEHAIRLTHPKNTGNFTYEWLCDIETLNWVPSIHTYTGDNGEEKIYEDSVSEDDLKQYYYRADVVEFYKWVELAKSFIETGELKGFDTDNSFNEDTALMGTRNKEMLLSVQGGLEKQAERLEGMQRVVNMKMAEQQRKMDVLKRELDEKLSVFKKQIDQIMRVITIIELYLGIEEELHQIRDGAPAPIETPITFRQQILYMDEETAILDDGGLDFKDVEKFDEWLLKERNYKKLIPEEKGVIAFHPRRHDKDYGDKYLNATFNGENKYQTYFLIRNGEKLFRVFTDKIVVLERLFPKRAELQELFDSIQTGLAKKGYSQEREAKESESKMYFYRKIAFFYQGLIDRTEVFSPVPEKTSVFSVGEYPERFNFIYDAESLLGDGRLPFWDWHKAINEKIERGTRIVITKANNSRDGYLGQDELEHRVFYYTNNAPPAPCNGVYEVYSKFEERTEKLPHYTIEEFEAKGLIIKTEPGIVAAMCPGYEKHAGNWRPSSPDTVIRTFKENGHEYIEAYRCKFKKRSFFY